MELLNRMLEWIKTHKKRFIVLVILVFIVPIISVQAAYSIPSIIPSFTSPLSAGDLLGYFAAFIATAGTVFLGAVAVWQNYIINEKARQFQEYTRNQEIKASEPKLKCTLVEFAIDSRIKNPSIIESYPLFTVTISNASENGASNIHIEDSYITHAKNSKKENLIPDANIDYLEKFKSSKLPFKISFSELKDCELNFTIHYEDKYGGTHKQHVIAYSENSIVSEWSINNIDELDNENK